NGGGKGRAISATTALVALGILLDIVTVDEIKPAQIRDSSPKRVTLRLSHFVPAHMGNLQAHASRIPELAKSADRPRDHLQAVDFTFLAVIEQHLQAYADAKKGLVFRGFDHGFCQAPRPQLPHAV